MAEGYLEEAEVQNLIQSNLVVKNGILNVLDLDNNDVSMVREDTYINGITADFTLCKSGKIKAIIECKSGNINVTDYVRGIGQLFQYEYFKENSVYHRGLEYDDDFSTIYFYPSTVIKNNSFNIAKFKYPSTTKILELNDCNNAVRLISRDELYKLSSAEDNNLITVSQYYFRDNRLFEYYILLHYLLQQSMLGHNKVDRKIAEIFLKRINSINNGNWRNAFITLSSLGLIDNNNLPSEAGKNLAILSYAQFSVKMYHSYLEPYFTLFFNCFNNASRIKCSNQDLSEIIKQSFSGKDVLYVTQSEGRYISSWMNIFRDDFGVINFEPKHNVRTLVYNPNELTDQAFADKIKQFSIAEMYINRYLDLLRRV